MKRTESNPDPVGSIVAGIFAAVVFIIGLALGGC